MTESQDMKHKRRQHVQHLLWRTGVKINIILI